LADQYELLKWFKEQHDKDSQKFFSVKEAQELTGGNGDMYNKINQLYLFGFIESKICPGSKNHFLLKYQYKKK
jgi:hypothetical protein